VTKDWLLKRQFDDNFVRFCTKSSWERIEHARDILAQTEALENPPGEYIAHMKKEIGYMEHFMKTVERLEGEKDVTKVI
jgi:hypothetical protein